MKAAHESPDQHKERSERHLPAHKAPAPAPVIEARGLAFDGLGNRALLSLLRSGRLQRQARISQPGDALEHEADRVADVVVAGSRSASAVDGSLPAAPAEGQPLPPEVRRGVESALGADLAGVRVYSGSAAGRQAESLGARAFTHRQDIFLGPHESPGDVRLLAHESAHTVQQARGRFAGIQRQPTDKVYPIHIKIGDATRLTKDYQWHYDTMPKEARHQLAQRIQDSFSFLPAQFHVIVDWGQFSKDDLKHAGNVQIWLIPEGAPELVAPVMGQYGYAEDQTSAVQKDLFELPEHFGLGESNERASAVTPKKPADPKHDPITARPVIIKVPLDLDPTGPGKDPRAKAAFSHRLAQVGYTALHETGHAFVVPHAKGNLGAVSKESGNRQESFPPDIMDEVLAFHGRDTDDPDRIFTKAEVDAIGGEEKLKSNPAVQKVETVKGDHGEKLWKVWYDLNKVKYSETEQAGILGTLQGLAPSMAPEEPAGKKAKK